MLHERYSACATLAIVALLLAVPCALSANEGVLSYTGGHSVLSDGIVLLELENHGYAVQAEVTVSYTYACEMGPEQHTSTTTVDHAERGTIWVSLLLEQPSTPEMCFGAPTLDAVAIEIVSATPLSGQAANSAPTVTITTLFPLSGLIPFSVTASGAGADEDGSIAAWEWDFGDGAIYTGEGSSTTVTHTYADMGTYLVFLKMWDDRGAVAYAFGKVKAVSKIPSADGGIRVVGFPVQHHELTFDASNVFSSEPIGTAHAWDFGDGSGGTGPLVTHQYASGGTYTVTLVSTFPEGYEVASTIEVAIAENGVPTAVPASTGDGLARQFDASGSSDPDGDELTYQWDFGDGSGGTGPLVTHQYASGGSYVVRLTASDGYASHEAEIEVMVAGLSPPVGSITISGNPKEGSTLEFDASGSSDPDGDELTYQWDFGDGGSANGIRASYAYETVGTYTVVLTVSDGTHLATAFQTVSVCKDSTDYLMYLVPLIFIVAALLAYTIKFGPKNTFEGVDLVRKEP